VIFILARAENPQNVMIIGRLVGNLIIPPQQTVSALFKLIELGPQIIQAIEGIKPGPYPFSAADAGHKPLRKQLRIRDDSDRPPSSNGKEVAWLRQSTPSKTLSTSSSPK